MSFELEMDPEPEFPSADEIRDEFFKAGVKLVNFWKDNLRTGQGAMGSHGGPYVNTGEAVKSVQMYPERRGADEYIIFSDAIQVLTAEVGQPPGHRPPFRAISMWVHEKLGVKRGDPAHFPIVTGIQDKIEEVGLEPFAPMEKAVTELVKDLEEKLGQKLEVREK